MQTFLIVVGVILIVLGGYAGWALTHPTTLRTEIEIAADAADVWAVLVDRAAYPEWNPLVTSSTGELRPGATITNVMQNKAGKESTFSPDRVRFVHEEDFRGIAVPFLRNWLRSNILPQFEAMNTALATRLTAR